MNFHFNKKYLLITFILFLIELSITMFLKDKLIRPFIGDVLVVLLVYSFVRIFLNAKYQKIAFGAFLFACLIEVLQYFDYVKLLGLENNKILSTVMGRTFELSDFFAYFIGFCFIIVCEFFLQKLENS